MKTSLKLKKGDMVKVLQGKDRGKQGEIVRAIPEERKVIVAGVNISKRHQRGGQRSGDTAPVTGGIIDKDMPMHVANVALVCPNCGITRVGYRIQGEGETREKVRICRKCGGEV